MDFVGPLFIRLFFNKRFKREGDIDVWLVVNIKCDKVWAIFDSIKCHKIEDNDYLF